MTGPLRLVTLIAGMWVLYIPMLILQATSKHMAWFWFDGMMGCLACYFIIWGIGMVKGWWTTKK
jgi:hypothetical protein